MSSAHAKMDPAEFLALITSHHLSLGIVESSGSSLKYGFTNARPMNSTDP